MYTDNIKYIWNHLWGTQSLLARYCSQCNTVENILAYGGDDNSGSRPSERGRKLPPCGSSLKSHAAHEFLALHTIYTRRSSGIRSTFRAKKEEKSPETARSAKVEIVHALALFFRTNGLLASCLAIFSAHPLYVMLAISCVYRAKRAHVFTLRSSPSAVWDKYVKEENALKEENARDGTRLRLAITRAPSKNQICITGNRFLPPARQASHFISHAHVQSSPPSRPPKKVLFFIPFWI